MSEFNKLINLALECKAVPGVIYRVPAAPDLVKYKIINAQVDLNKSDVTNGLIIRNNNI